MEAGCKPEDMGRRCFLLEAFSGDAAAHGLRGVEKIPPTSDCAIQLPLDSDLPELLICPGYGKAEIERTRHEKYVGCGNRRDSRGCWKYV